MRYSTPEADPARSAENRAAVFVDYENLFIQIHSRLNSRGRPEDLITELLEELRRYLLEELRTQTAEISAYADFSEMHGNGQFIQRALYMGGVEPRFVPATLQRNAAEIQLCVDAVEVLHNRSDIRTFVIVTGDRAYLPLVQQFRRYGRQALIVSLSPPPSTESLPQIEDDVFLDAANLFSDASRRLLGTGRGRETGAPSTGSYRRGRPQPVEYQSITNPGTLQALEIIEEHFGQYEEVYLTPLLRKLSELLDENLYDPKTLISELEEAGAVWLEKRRGFPYDYTVLLIDADHPDVAQIQKELYEQEQDTEDYYDDEYEDEFDDYVEDVEDLDDDAYSNGAPDDTYDNYLDEGEDYVDAGEEDDEPR